MSVTPKEANLFQQVAIDVHQRPLVNYCSCGKVVSSSVLKKMPITLITNTHTLGIQCFHTQVWFTFSFYLKSKNVSLHASRTLAKCDKLARQRQGGDCICCCGRCMTITNHTPLCTRYLA